LLQIGKIVSKFQSTYKMLAVDMGNDDVFAVVTPDVNIDFGIDKLVPLLLALVDDAVKISKNVSNVNDERRINR
jgi:hypothetical protein